jgi:ribokinase
MSAKVCVVGSANTDMVLRLPRIPKPGETVPGGQFATVAGGKGANQAVAAARAGGRVTFIARVGADAFGRQAVQNFMSDGIDVSAVSADGEKASGVALIFVGENGENAIGVASGANASLTPQIILSHRDKIEGSDIVLLQLESPLESVIQAVELASRRKIPVVLNPAPALTLPRELIARLTVITPNESEAELLTGVAVTDDGSAAKAASILLGLGAANVIITMGRHGAFLANAYVSKRIPAVDAGKVVDTTAAGDVFNGALAVALAEGKDMHTAVHFANAAAALSVTKPGAQPSAPKRDAIERLLAGLDRP